jgi:hypothetical protein
MTELATINVDSYIIVSCVHTLAYFDVLHFPNLIHYFQPMGKIPNGI